MNIFTAQINSWSEWSKLFHDIETWYPLIEYIFQKEELPFTPIENLTPGTNAVFRVGKYVIKIYAPTESGMDQTPDLQTELFAMCHVEKLGVSVPQLIRDGFV